MTASERAFTGEDAFDERAALEEIDLYAEVLIAAGAASEPFTQDEIDRILGLRPSSPAE